MAEAYMHLAFDIQEQQENERFIIEDTEGVRFESSSDMQNKHFFQGKEEISDEATPPTQKPTQTPTSTILKPFFIGYCKHGIN